MLIGSRRVSIARIETKSFYIGKTYIKKTETMNNATKLWKANLDSEYHSMRKRIENGELVSYKVKYSEDGEWKELVQ